MSKDDRGYVGVLAALICLANVNEKAALAATFCASVVVVIAGIISDLRGDK